MTTTLDLGGEEVTIRPFVRADAVEVARFASSLPEHDLLFLNRDIQNARVVGAWLGAVDAGEIESLIVLHRDRAVATTAIVRDLLGWSAHVAEVRLLVAPEWRGKGLGRALLEAIIRLASESGAEKLVARMTLDQAGAITLFEEAGFRGEAMLRDHVRDRGGALHDLAILSLGLARAAGGSEAYGSVAE